MKLINDFFSINNKTIDGDKIEYNIQLNPSHFIYEAHFPDNPITPGVCITQIVQELVGQYLQCELMLKKISKAKFLNVINPLEYPTIDIAFTISPEEDDYKVNATVYKGDITFSQSALILRPIE